MIGVYDFCGHYEWTFAWLQRQGGAELLKQYWDEAIHRDAQSHAAELILQKGIAGMQEYWGHSLSQEGGSHYTTAAENAFRIDIHDCPSKGFLLRNGLEQHEDYCDHCIGWIGPMLKRAAFVIDHQHNHCGQCWWEFRRASDPARPSKPGEFPAEKDVRLRADWKRDTRPLDSWQRANSPDQKKTEE